MSIIVGLREQHAIADAAFAALEQDAFSRDDDTAFDIATEQRRLNDQAYFLYLFTRFESEVNDAVDALLQVRRDSRLPWPERRVWDAWARNGTKDIAFLSKVEVLIDKSTPLYTLVKELYKRRNAIGHGGTWGDQVFIAVIAQKLDEAISRFART